jgi:hypothetical protein
MAVAHEQAPRASAQTEAALRQPGFLNAFNVTSCRSTKLSDL